MGDTITIDAADGSGSFRAYVAKPANGTGPAIVAIQEIFGVNAGMREICDTLAEQGYIAVCPDLFWRQEPGVDITDQTKEEWDKAFKLMNGFNMDKGVDDIASTIAVARAMASNGKVGTVGYCLGGRLAYLAATRTDTDASVSYYGVMIDSLLTEAKNIEKPLMMHIAEKDQFVNAEAQAKMHAGLGDHPLVSLHDYAGMDHAFARPHGTHYNDSAATLANSRTAAFFTRHLKG